MRHSTVRSVLDCALEPVGGCLTPDAARRLLKLKLAKKAQARLDVLADKCTDGDLSVEERAEYESSVLTLELLTLLQVEAQVALADREPT